MKKRRIRGRLQHSDNLDDRVYHIAYGTGPITVLHSGEAVTLCNGSARTPAHIVYDNDIGLWYLVANGTHTPNPWDADTIIIR